MFIWKLGVLWDRELSPELNRSVIRIQKIDGDWSPEIMGEVFWEHTQAVLSGGKDIDRKQIFYILQRSYDGEETGLGMFQLKNTGIPWPSVYMEPNQILSGSTPSSINPSITVLRQYDQDWRHFCWEDEDEIIYLKETYGEPVVVSAPAWEGTNHHPSIAIDAQNRINIVWDQVGSTYPGTSFNHRRSEDGVEWEPLQRIVADFKFITYPSVGAFENSENGELKAAFIYEEISDNSQAIEFFHFNGDGWTWQEESFPGIYAGMTDKAPDLLTVWTDHSMGLPNLIESQFWSEAESMEGGENIFKENQYRTILFDLSDLLISKLNGQVSLSLGNIELMSKSGSQTWNFPAISDTQLTFAQTPSIQIGKDQDSLKFSYRIWIDKFSRPANLPVLPLLQIQLREKDKTQPLAIVKHLNVNSLSSPSLAIEDELTIDLKPFQGKTISLKMDVLPGTFTTVSSRSTLVNVKEIDRGTPIENLTVIDEQVAVQKLIPDRYEIYQNFPNPFNPSTTIVFDLPADSPVRLEIFEVTGRRIKTLVSEPMPAGTHQATWNGQDDLGNAVASGLYIYRIQAGDFVQSRKMLFVK